MSFIYMFTWISHCCFYCYSDFKKCSRVEDTSDESIETSLTPGVNLRNLDKKPSSSTINPLEEKTRTSKKNELQAGDKLRKVEEPPGDSLIQPGDRLNTDEINPGDKLKRKELSPLSDLPPLGSLSSQLGETNIFSKNVLFGICRLSGFPQRLQNYNIFLKIDWITTSSNLKLCVMK